MNPETAPATGAEPTTSEDLLNATIIERIDLHEAQSIFRIRLDAGPTPQFEAGQYAMLALPRPEALMPKLPPGIKLPPRKKPAMIKRAYSIASSPKVREYLEFLIVVVDEGKLTPLMWNLQTGARIMMEDVCKGEFTLKDVPPGKDLIMVSTGTGIAPFISMLDTYRGENRWNRLVMINGCRYARDLAYVSEMEAICRSDPSVVFIPAVTREPPESTWQGLRGRVTGLLDEGVYDKLVGAPLTSEQCHVLLCGNPEMIDDLQKKLEARGFTLHNRENPHGNIHFERYW